MDSLLDALQEGRLIELPDNDKMDALQFLAHIIEAIPSLPAGTDVAGLILAKEQTSQTSLGMGWACPDARVPFDEDRSALSAGARRASTTAPRMESRCPSLPCTWYLIISVIITCARSPCWQRP